MCTVCGLPSTHTNVAQAIGLLGLFSFTLITFLSAWWILVMLDVKNWVKKWRGDGNDLGGDERDIA